ncbi:hypothetical protein ACFLZZ_02890 [Nanoarchaeota archaeon]
MVRKNKKTGEMKDIWFRRYLVLLVATVLVLSLGQAIITGNASRAATTDSTPAPSRTVDEAPVGIKNCLEKGAPIHFNDKALGPENPPAGTNDENKGLIKNSAGEITGASFWVTGQVACQFRDRKVELDKGTRVIYVRKGCNDLKKYGEVCEDRLIILNPETASKMKFGDNELGLFAGSPIVISFNTPLTPKVSESLGKERFIGEGFILNGYECLREDILAEKPKQDLCNVVTLKDGLVWFAGDVKVVEGMHMFVRPSAEKSEKSVFGTKLPYGDRVLLAKCDAYLKNYRGNMVKYCKDAKTLGISSKAPTKELKEGGEVNFRLTKGNPLFDIESESSFYFSVGGGDLLAVIPKREDILPTVLHSYNARTAVKTKKAGELKINLDDFELLASKEGIDITLGDIKNNKEGVFNFVSPSIDGLMTIA